MKQLRHWIPVFGILALAALFLKLPEIPNFFNLFSCKTCSSTDPFLPLIGASYFAALIAVSLLFPGFPGPRLARGGFTWAVLLALTLTYVDLPRLCAVCLIAHACNILIWMIWIIVPTQKEQLRSSPLKERFCLMLFATISIAALFSCLNLTFMAYNFKNKSNVANMGLRLGDAAPNIAAQTMDGRLISNDSRLVINFISPDCPFCKEQLQILNAVAAEQMNATHRFINISPRLPTEMIQSSPAMEWVEDEEGNLRNLFKVPGYPMLFVVGTDGRIAEIIPGVPEQLKKVLTASLD